MPTNDEIKHKYYLYGKYLPNWITDGDVDRALSEARSDTTKKHTGTIWNWWNTKPQKRKNDMTVRIITRTDIVELVRLME